MARRQNTGPRRSATSGENIRQHIVSPYCVPIVSKTFQIIERLRESPNPLSVKQVSDSTGVALSSTYRIMRTMFAYGYLSRIRGGRFALCMDNSVLASPDRRTR